jgi:predicted RNA-binding Zn-ribbon protein involved in translation (DUF1610 family)
MVWNYILDEAHIMKIIRSTRLALKFANAGKQSRIATLLTEYGRCCNEYVQLFWAAPIRTSELLKPVVDQVQSDLLGFGFRQTCAREAIGLISTAKATAKERKAEAKMPVHHGQTMRVSTIQISLKLEQHGEFDTWIGIRTGKGSFWFPTRRHEHFNALAARGRLQGSYLIRADSIQVSFEIETGPKQITDRCVGVDTGIQTLASLHTGQQLGTEFRPKLERVLRCQHGSRGQKRASRALKHYIDLVAKQVTQSGSLIVVENLKGITFNLKRRLGKKMRRLVSRWQVRYWLTRLEAACQDRNVSFRSVPAWWTSQTCPECGHRDQKNRVSQELFVCQRCGHTGNADVNAARNILARFITGPYAAGCKAAPSDHYILEEV